jgi:predicted transcriptional regulator
MAQLSANDIHVEAFKALAHLSRLQVFFVLVKAGRDMSVGEIQEAVEIPGATLSQHLDMLRRAGLVEGRAVHLLFGAAGASHHAGASTLCLLLGGSHERKSSSPHARL